MLFGCQVALYSVMELIANSTYRLSSGREFYANCGIIGMNPPTGLRVDVPDAWRDSIYKGYDGSQIIRAPEWMEDTSRDWTDAERKELAEFMVALWREWGNLP